MKNLSTRFVTVMLCAACSHAGQVIPPSSAEGAPPSNAESTPIGASAPTAEPPASADAALASDVEHRDEAALLAQLKNTKLSLAQGIEQAERTNGLAISAKFELHDGKLSLSVYTARAGAAPDAEHNELIELSGDPTQSEWAPKTEVFADKKHITRAAFHLTVVQQARLPLKDVIAKAAKQQPGVVYSIEPNVKERKPIFHVLVATEEGKSVLVDVGAS